METCSTSPIRSSCWVSRSMERGLSPSFPTGSSFLVLDPRLGGACSQPTEREVDENVFCRFRVGSLCFLFGVVSRSHLCFFVADNRRSEHYVEHILSFGICPRERHTYLRRPFPHKQMIHTVPCTEKDKGKKRDDGVGHTLAETMKRRYFCTPSMRHNPPSKKSGYKTKGSKNWVVHERKKGVSFCRLIITRCVPPFLSVLLNFPCPGTWARRKYTHICTGAKKKKRKEGISE